LIFASNNEPAQPEDLWKPVQRAKKRKPKPFPSDFSFFYWIGLALFTSKSYKRGIKNPTYLTPNPSGLTFRFIYVFLSFTFSSFRVNFKHWTRRKYKVKRGTVNHDGAG